jgi:hypothetical protein
LISADGLFIGLSGFEANCDQNEGNSPANINHDKLTLLLCGNKNIKPSAIPLLLSHFSVNIIYSPFSQKLRDGIEVTVRSICVAFSLAVQAEFEVMDAEQGEEYFTEVNPRLSSLVQAFLKKQQTVIDALRAKVENERDSMKIKEEREEEEEVSEQFSEPELRRSVSRCCVQYLSTASLAIFCEVGTKLLIKKDWEDREMEFPEEISQLSGEALERFRKDAAEVGRIWDELWTTRVAAHYTLRAIRSGALGLRSQAIVSIPQQLLANATQTQIKNVVPNYGDSAIDVIESQTASLFHFKSIFQEDEDEDEDENLCTTTPECIAYASLFETFFEEIITNPFLVQRESPNESQALEDKSTKQFISYTPSFKECLLLKTKGERIAEELETFFGSFLANHVSSEFNKDLKEHFQLFFKTTTETDAAAIVPAFKTFLFDNFKSYFSTEEAEHEQLGREASGALSVSLSVSLSLGVSESDAQLICDHCAAACVRLNKMHSTLSTAIKTVSNDDACALSPHDLLLLYSMSIRSTISEFFVTLPPNVVCFNSSLLISQVLLVSLLSTDPLPLLLLTTAKRNKQFISLNIADDNPNTPYISTTQERFDSEIISCIWNSLSSTRTQKETPSLLPFVPPEESTQADFFRTLFKHYFVLSVTQEESSPLPLFTAWERLVFELGASSYLLFIDVENIEFSQRQLHRAISYANTLHAPLRSLWAKGTDLHGFDFSILPSTLVSVSLNNCNLEDDDFLKLLSVFQENGEALSLQDCPSLQDSAVVALFGAPKLREVNVSGNFRITQEAKLALKKRGIKVVSDLFTEHILSIIHSFETKNLKLLSGLIKDSILQLEASSFPLEEMGTNENTFSFCQNFESIVTFLYQHFPKAVLFLLEEIHYPFLPRKDPLSCSVSLVLHGAPFTHLCSVAAPLTGHPFTNPKGKNFRKVIR